MKLLHVDHGAFYSTLSRAEELANKLNKLLKISKEGTLRDWIDAQEVYKILHIKPRTLQNLRTNGTLAYTRIGRKIFYREEHVRSLIKPVNIGKGKE